MIIKLSDIKKTLKNYYKFYLFFGSNTGQIEEIISNVFKTEFLGNTFSYEEIDILSNKDRFLISVLNKSFFDDKKLIIINNATDKILEIIKSLHSKEIYETIIIVKTNILEKKSKLRVFFEQNKTTISVPFYEDNYKTLHLLAQNFFREKKINISTQIINFLVEKSKNNRTNLKNELLKIESFVKKKNFIHLKDILKLSTNSENYKLSELTDFYLIRNKKIINILNENIHSPEDNILILKNLLFKLKRLKKIKKEVEQNNNEDFVISSYRPLIFWKDKDMIKQQLKNLSISDIKTLIIKTNKIEQLIKKNSSLAVQILNNFFLETIENSNNII